MPRRPAPQRRCVNRTTAAVLMSASLVMSSLTGMMRLSASQAWLTALGDVGCLRTHRGG